MHPNTRLLKNHLIAPYLPSSTGLERLLIGGYVYPQDVQQESIIVHSKSFQKRHNFPRVNNLSKCVKDFTKRR